MSANAMVAVEGLWCQFDVSRPWLNRILNRAGRSTLTAVADVSFAIPQRKTFALVGESGSGKSTIAKMVVGLIPPTRGNISIAGSSMTDKADSARRQKHRRRIQMIFQDPYASLNPRWRVRRILAEPLRVFGLEKDRSDSETRIQELLRLVGLDAADAGKFPHEFSGGQRQRIAIARAIAAEPSFIVCDEPTSALDVSVQAQILNLMRELQERLGLTYLFISHNLAVVRHMASDIGVLYLGRLVEVAPSKELFDRPRHPYTQMLLDAVPDLESIGSRVRRPIEGEAANPINPPSGCAFHPRCPYRNDRCKREVPLLMQIADRKVACHGISEGRL
jgi:peptide/nickel transport system ATP-binding protein